MTGTGAAPSGLLAENTPCRILAHCRPARAPRHVRSWRKETSKPPAGRRPAAVSWEGRGRVYAPGWPKIAARLE